MHLKTTFITMALLNRAPRACCMIHLHGRGTQAIHSVQLQIVPLCGLSTDCSPLYLRNGIRLAMFSPVSPCVNDPLLALPMHWLPSCTLLQLQGFQLSCYCQIKCYIHNFLCISMHEIQQLAKIHFSFNKAHK